MASDYSGDRNGGKRESFGPEFAIGALSAVGAGTITNPVDVVKIRLQLQGELESRGSYKKIYSNTFHAAYVIAKHEGIFALQSGLTPALLFQVCLNGIRLGGYKTAKKYQLIQDEKGKTHVLRTILVSGISGCIGAIVGSPFYLIKTQMQSTSKSCIAVGHQHQHKNTYSALKSLWKDGGFSGLYRGWHVGTPRVFIGSATQLTTFGLFSDYLKSFQSFDNRPITLTFVASLLGGSCVAVAMQPFDVLATRLYNQKTDKSGKGTLYNGLMDGFVKILRTEGILGLYKGVFPTWMRLAPHTVLCLVFYEKLDQFYKDVVAR